MVAKNELAELIWHNGRFIKWADATIHVMSHVVHYGTSVFEGIRCYNTSQGPAVFRLEDHIQRLFNSAKIYRMVPEEYSVEDIIHACAESVKVNHFTECYIRPVIFRGLGEFGVNPFNCPIQTYIVTWKKPWSRAWMSWFPPGSGFRRIPCLHWPRLVPIT